MIPLLADFKSSGSGMTTFDAHHINDGLLNGVFPKVHKLVL
jgi:hypothetical protein